MGKAKGRPRRSGKRTKAGRLITPQTFDQGTDWVRAMKARFGEHYSTALGRAFALGFLGEGVEANDRFQAGKRFMRLHRIVYGGTHYRCPLNDSPRGNVSDMHEGVNLNDRQWLDAAIDSMDVAGVRPYLDQLLSTLYTDAGPYWLDNLFEVILWNEDYIRWNREELPVINAYLIRCGKEPEAPRERREFDIRDQIVLAAAIRALDIMAPERKQSQIISVGA